MTIDAAIAHAREVARVNRLRTKHPAVHRNYEDEIEACLLCAEEHEQLAEWLELLKWYEQGMEDIPCESGVLPKDVYWAGYNKAIDDFKKMMTIEKIKEYAESDGFINLNNCSLMIFDIAEQLKEGSE